MPVWLRGLRSWQAHQEDCWSALLGGNDAQGVDVSESVRAVNLHRHRDRVACCSGGEDLMPKVLQKQFSRVAGMALSPTKGKKAARAGGASVYVTSTGVERVRASDLLATTSVRSTLKMVTRVTRIRE